MGESEPTHTHTHTNETITNYKYIHVHTCVSHTQNITNNTKRKTTIGSLVFQSIIITNGNGIMAN